MIAAATSALVAASCILMIRYGLMYMAHSARSPAQLKERAKRQAGIARAKLRLAFKWALLAHGIHDDLPSSGTNGAPDAAAWLQNPWLREHVASREPECGSAVEPQCGTSWAMVRSHCQLLQRASAEGHII